MLTPTEAVSWAGTAAIWVCAATPGQGYSFMMTYMVNATVCLFAPGEHHDALRRARQLLAAGRVGQCHGHGRQVRVLLVFLRRLTRQVEGYVAPSCGWCSDTGVEYQTQHPDYWPVSCHACQPDAHRHQTGFRETAKGRR